MRHDGSRARSSGYLVPPRAVAVPCRECSSGSPIRLAAWSCWGRKRRAQRGHGEIGTEHMLLGLVDEGECDGAKALEMLRISPTEVRTHVDEIVGRADVRRKPTGRHAPHAVRQEGVGAVVAGGGAARSPRHRYRAHPPCHGPRRQWRGRAGARKPRCRSVPDARDRRRAGDHPGRAARAGTTEVVTRGGTTTRASSTMRRLPPRRPARLRRSGSPRRCGDDSRASGVRSTHASAHAGSARAAACPAKPAHVAP